MTSSSTHSCSEIAGPDASNSNSARINVLLCFYESARTEMLLRIKEREVATYVWITAVCTILTITFSSSPHNNEIMLAIPLLSLAFAFRISQHEMLIATLAKYCKDELGPQIRSDPALADLRHWDESHSLAHYQKSVVSVRAMVNLFLLLVPSIGALAANVSLLESHRLLLRSVWYTDVLAGMAGGWFIVSSFAKRLAAAMKEVHNSAHPL